MRILFLGAGLALAACLGGCASDSSSSGHDIVQSVDGRSAVDTLMALVAVRARSQDPALDGAYVDHRHLKSMRLSVDGRSWGLYAFAQEALPAPADDAFALSKEPMHGMLIADLADDLESSDDALDSIAQWVSLLERHLAPGRHVARIDELTLIASDGSTATLQPRVLVPFDIEQGDATAYLGEIEVDLDVEGEAP